MDTNAVCSHDGCEQPHHTSRRDETASLPLKIHHINSDDVCPPPLLACHTPRQQKRRAQKRACRVGVAEAFALDAAGRQAGGGDSAPPVRAAEA